MKGMIFTELLEMVEATWGPEAVENLLTATPTSTAGAYTAVGNYPAAELVALASTLCRQHNMSMSALQEAFGGRIHTLFTQRYGHFFLRAGGCFNFLQGIENYIHVEVRKLYPDAELPTFTYPHVDATTLVMRYQSQRPLAHFALGLIRASIAHFAEPITVQMELAADGQGTDAVFTLRKQ